MEWYEIASYVVGIAGAVFGLVFYTKWNQFVNLLKETGEAFTKTAEALEDRKVTKAEALQMLDEWADVYMAFLLLIPERIVNKIFRRG